MADKAPTLGTTSDPLPKLLAEADAAVEWAQKVYVGHPEMPAAQANGLHITQQQAHTILDRAAAAVIATDFGPRGPLADVEQRVMALVPALRDIIDWAIRHHGRQPPPWQNEVEPPWLAAPIQTEVERIGMLQMLQAVHGQLRLLQTLRPTGGIPEALSEVAFPSPALPPTRPTEPTVSYCLPRTCIIRWNGETRVRPKLWKLLHAILAAPSFTLPLRQVEKDVYGQSSKSERSVRNDLTALNDALDEVKLPLALSMTGKGRDKVVQAVEVTKESQKNHH